MRGCNKNIIQSIFKRYILLIYTCNRNFVKRCKCPIRNLIYFFLTYFVMRCNDGRMYILHCNSKYIFTRYIFPMCETYFFLTYKFKSNVFPICICKSILFLCIFIRCVTLSISFPMCNSIHIFSICIGTSFFPMNNFCILPRCNLMICIFCKMFFKPVSIQNEYYHCID